MNGEHWYVVRVNPEPWAIGPLGVGRKGGKVWPYIGPNPQLDAYKKAVRESLRDQNPVIVEGEVEVKFWFWRRLDGYQNKAGRTLHKHAADATNLQKATEDAIQGILIGNDRYVLAPSSVIMAQDKEIEGMVLICVKEVSNHEDEIPPHIWDKMQADLKGAAVAAQEPYVDPESIF